MKDNEHKDPAPDKSESQDNLEVPESTSETGPGEAEDAASPAEEMPELLMDLDTQIMKMQRVDPWPGPPGEQEPSDKGKGEAKGADEAG